MAGSHAGEQCAFQDKVKNERTVWIREGHLNGPGATLLLSGFMDRLPLSNVTPTKPELEPRGVEESGNFLETFMANKSPTEFHVAPGRRPKEV